MTDYAQLTAMLAPRPALLTNNAEDNCCFRAEHALPPLLEAAAPVYDLYGRRSHLRYHVNHEPGSHNFDQDNRQQLYQLLGDFFYTDSPEFNAEEISCEGELKSKDELDVEIPSGNLDFNSLAHALSKNLQRGLPSGPDSLAPWQQERRPLLKEVVRAKELDTLAIRQSQADSDSFSASWWWLRFAGDWTVPAVQLCPTNATSDTLTILVADEGRSSLTEAAEKLLQAGHRVLAIDPFFFGESKISQRDFLYAILVSSLGDRPLGIQAGQLGAAAKWARDKFGCKRVELVAFGPRTSLIALVAGSLREESFDAITVHGSLGTLRELIEQNMGMNQVPESLCFGLLKHFDIPQLVAMCGPDQVHFVEVSDRCHQELAPLRRLFPDAVAQLGKEAPASDPTEEANTNSESAAE